MCWTVLKRLYEMNKDSVDKAVRERLQDELSEKEKPALWVQVQWKCKIHVDFHISDGLLIHLFRVIFLILEVRRDKNQM